MSVRGRLGLGIREERIVLRNTVIRPGSEVRHHDEAAHPGLFGSIDHTDCGVAVDGIGACGVAAAGSGGKHHRVVPGEQLGQRIGVQCLDIRDDRMGTGRGHVVGVVGIAEDRRHAVTALGQDASQVQSDLAVAADDHDACHAGDVTRGSGSTPPPSRPTGWSTIEATTSCRRRYVMPEAVIVEAIRSPIGKRNGGLSGVHPADLSAQVLNGLVEKAGIDPEIVDDVIWGCVMQAGEQALDIARTALLSAGWPETVPGVTVDRQCGSSQQSIHFAAAGVAAGHYDVVVAGGVESMSRVPMGSSLAGGGRPYPDDFLTRYHGAIPNQGIGAEMIAEQWGFDRTALDEFSLGSHEKAAAAQDSGAFDDQIVAIKDQDGNPVLKDEGIRRGTTIDKMAELKPAFKEDGVIHAGNSSQISDGSAALLFMSAEKAKSLKLNPIAKVHTATLAGADPVIMLTAPIPATQKALKRSGLKPEDIGVFEVNEAFAPVPLAWLKDIGADEKKLNPNGGAIALGHPLGGSGARIMTTMLYHMRDKGIRYGLQTMCEGGGQANATIVELL